MKTEKIGNIAFYSNRNTDKVVIHNYVINSWFVSNKSDVDYIKNIVANPPSKLDMSNEIDRKIAIYQILNSSEENSPFSKNVTTIPKVLYFISTYKCNLNCIYCYAESSPFVKTDKELSTNELEILFNDAYTLGVELVVFTGGETGLRKDCFKLMKYVKSIGLKINLISNGTFINESSKAKWLAENCEQITISLDSLDKINNDLNRGKGSYKKATAAINLLKKHGANLKINQVITTHNRTDYQDMITYTDQNNFKLNFGGFCETGRGNSNNASITIEDKINVEHSFLKYNSDREESQLYPFSRRNHCGLGISEFAIDSCGMVYTCKVLGESALKAGNLKIYSLEQIINKSTIFKMARNCSVDSIDECKKCTFKYLCGGGCRATHYYKTGSLYKVDKQECMLAKESIYNYMLENG